MRGKGNSGRYLHRGGYPGWAKRSSTKGKGSITKKSSATKKAAK